ncbi:hypothetical protein FACS1894188_04580 [Clostridia bacterium]|nr:hypothetical protein FACS1894188_04580 [Clostridia bacterium]
MPTTTFNISDNVTLSYNAEDSDIGVGLYEINYHTYVENNPKTAGNIIGLWKADSNGHILANATALTIVAVSASNNDGTYGITIERLSEVNYAFAYIFNTTLSPTEKGFGSLPVGAVLALPSGLKSLTDPAKLYNFNLSLVLAGGDTQLKYEGIANTNPSANKHWIGVWDNDNFDLSKPPVYAAPISGTKPKGITSIDHEVFHVNQEYTLFYFAGGYNDSDKDESSKDSIAASVVFSV